MGTQFSDSNGFASMRVIVTQTSGQDSVFTWGTLNHSATPNWQQPTFTSASNSHGTITGTFTDPYDAYKAFDSMLPTNPFAPLSEWSLSGTSGWVQLTLNYNIVVTEIIFVNGTSTVDNRTRNANFTGTGGVALGSPFTAVNSNLGMTVIPVNNVVTNTIRLNVTSSYGSWIGASEIKIIGCVV
jgi:hypothetical protein